MEKNTSNPSSNGPSESKAEGMKLIIQIPCLNEAEQLPETLADLPRSVPGVSVVEWLVIDDGSVDETVEVAFAHGVDHVVRLPQNRGLAAAFQSGLDAALKLGADIVVNTDADNQYVGADIKKLVAPIVEGRANLVIGDRNTATVEEFSRLKKRLQAFGSSVVRWVSKTQVTDATSGFRAYSKEAALQLSVVNQYTYTIESIIQAGRSNAAIESVIIGTNPSTRPSRLFGSMWGYIRRNSLTIVRVFAAYKPMRFFGAISALFFILSLAAFTPFFIDWVRSDTQGGHLQSLILGAILAMTGVQILVLAFVADLISAHRTISQRIFERVRRVELSVGVKPSHHMSTQDMQQRSRMRQSG